MDLKFSFLFVLALFCFACQQNGNMGTSISQLEKEVATQPTAENSKSLIDQYMAYLDQNPNDAKTNASYLYKAANLYFQQNRPNEAANLLKTSLKNYPAENTASTMSLLASIYADKLNSPILAQAVYQGLAGQFPNQEEGAAAKQKLNSASPGLDAHIESLRNQMYNDSTHRIDNRIARSYVEASELYALVKPKDAKSAELLFKAGETARSTRNFAKAIEIYDWIYTLHPQYEKAPQALFLKGFTLDNDLKQTDQAKAIYEEFLKKYPNDDFADDTKFLLGNIGKSDEEIIKNFEAAGSN